MLLKLLKKFVGKMSILGNGVDIVDNTRIKNAIKNKFFVSRIFTVNEIKKSKNLNNKANYFAKRFAAKEAFSKALGTGISKGLSFKDIEILNNKRGKPILNVNGKSKKIVKKLIKKRFKTFVSLSDEKSHAIASVIISIN